MAWKSCWTSSRTSICPSGEKRVRASFSSGKTSGKNHPVPSHPSQTMPKPALGAGACSLQELPLFFLGFVGAPWDQHFGECWAWLWSGTACPGKRWPLWVTEGGDSFGAPALLSPLGRHFWEAVFKVGSSCSLAFPSPWGIFAALRVGFAGLVLSGWSKDWVSGIWSIWGGWNLCRNEPSWAEQLLRSWNPLGPEQEVQPRRAGPLGGPSTHGLGWQLLEWMWSCWEHQWQIL